MSNSNLGDCIYYYFNVYQFFYDWLCYWNNWSLGIICFISRAFYNIPQLLFLSSICMLLTSFRTHEIFLYRLLNGPWLLLSLWTILIEIKLYRLMICFELPFLWNLVLLPLFFVSTCLLTFHCSFMF